MSELVLRPEFLIDDVSRLEALYGKPSPASVAKEVPFLHPHYRKFVEAAPFVSVATAGPDGLDCSPRGDAAGFVRVHDDMTLLIPDRRGNNRADSMRNLVVDPRIALLFLIPGIGETLRINGRAQISTDPELTASFAVDGKAPRSVLVVHIETVYFQCSRAIVRSRLWDPATRIERSALPSTGTVVGELSKNGIDGVQYDRDLPGRVAATLY